MLSKRTSLYAVYADIDNNDAAKDSGLYASIGDAMAGGVAGGDGYQRAVNLGAHGFSFAREIWGRPRAPQAGYNRRVVAKWGGVAGDN